MKHTVPSDSVAVFPDGCPPAVPSATVEDGDGVMLEEGDELGG